MPYYMYFKETQWPLLENQHWVKPYFSHFLLDPSWTSNAIKFGPPTYFSQHSFLPLIKLFVCYHLKCWFIGPNIVILYCNECVWLADNTTLITRLLKSLKPHGEIICSWEQNGEVFLDYLCLVEEVRGLQLAGDEVGDGIVAPDNLEAMVQRVATLTTKFNGLPYNTPKDM